MMTRRPVHPTADWHECKTPAAARRSGPRRAGAGGRGTGRGRDVPPRGWRPGAVLSMSPMGEAGSRRSGAGSEAVAERGRLATVVVMVGDESLGRGLAARRDVGAAEDRLVAPGVLGVTTQRAAAEGRLADRQVAGRGVGVVRDLEVVDLVLVVPRDVARHLGPLEL